MAIRIIGLSRRALGIALAVAMLAGCGQAQTGGAMPISSTSTQAKAHTMSGSSGDLLYVSDGRKGVRIFAFPQGDLVGIITGLVNARSQCANKYGNIFITQGGSGLGGNIVEFAHGGTSPINTLALPSFQVPQACSVDRATGNVAAVINNEEGQDNISIFLDGQGSPQVYSDPSIQDYEYCAYDDSGDLYIDGFYNGQFVLAVLPKGSDTFTSIVVNPRIASGRDLQWDGRYLAIGNVDMIYQVKLSGSKGNITNAIHMHKNNLEQFWIRGHTFVGGVPVSHGRGPQVVAFWRYPAGGIPTKVLSPSDFNLKSNITGLSISVAPSGSHKK